MVRLSKNVYKAQSKGDWLFLQLGYTAIHFKKLWGDKGEAAGCLRIELFAPEHDPKRGYSRTKFNMRICGK